MSAFFRLTGVAALAKAIEQSIDAAKGPQSYWVGSAVFYGPFIEFGTSKMAARPHWSMALQLIAIRYELATQEFQNNMINHMLVEKRGLVKRIAFDLEREVKVQIQVVGAIDTGNYRASIATAPTQDEAFALSEERSFR